MAQLHEADQTQWARDVVARYEAGGRVPRISLQSAMAVLGLKPGTVIRLGKQPAYDCRVAAAGED